MSTLAPAPSSHSSPPRPLAQSPDEGLLCPMCGYNLHGLSEPRCPECGRPFDWDELRDPDRRLHPYLYEHHPERGLRAFWQTLIGGLLPRRFWTTLRPAQPSRPRRLVKYWLLYTLPILLALGLAIAGDMMQYRGLMLAQRKQIRSMLTGWSTTNYHFGEPVLSLPELLRRLRDRVFSGGNPSFFASNEQFARNVLRQYGSVEAYLDDAYPLPPSWRFFENVWRYGMRGPFSYRSRYSDPVLLLLLAMAWPLATGATFRLFHWTMRRAKLRFVHLLRVSIYCCDALLWAAVLLAVPLLLTAFEMYSAGPTRWTAAGRGRWDDLLAMAMQWLPVLALAVITYRLIVATSKYLHFGQAIATVLSVQIILLLATWKLALVWSGF